MTTAKTAAKKSASNPIVGKHVADKLKAGQEPSAPAPDNKREDAKANEQLSTISTGACVTAMTKAFGFSKQYLQIEVAIALAIFATNPKGVTKESKDAVMAVYKEAGFDASPKGDDYKTCHRRMTVSSNLFKFIGVDEIQAAMEGEKEVEAIDMLTKYLLDNYAFRGVNDIIATYSGERPRQTNTAEARAARAEAKKAEAAAAKAPAPAPTAPAPAAGTPAPAAAPVTAEGQHLNIDGSPDKRSAPEGEIAQGQQTRAEHGLQGTTKAEAGQAPAALAGATPADHAVMAAMGEKAQERPLAEAGESRRRRADNGICLIAGNLELSIPYGTSGKDIFDLFTKLTVLANVVRDDTVIDERFDKFSNSPLHESTRQVAH